MIVIYFNRVREAIKKIIGFTIIVLIAFFLIFPLYMVFNTANKEIKYRGDLNISMHQQIIGDR